MTMFEITLSVAGGAKADAGRRHLLHTNTFVDRVYAIHKLQR